MREKLKRNGKGKEREKKMVSGVGRLRSHSASVIK